jgi:hypothetical protein
MQANWFESLFGFTEGGGRWSSDGGEYLRTKARFRVEGKNLRSLVNNKVYAIGDFSTPTLAELRAGKKICNYLSYNQQLLY